MVGIVERSVSKEFRSSTNNSRRPIPVLAAPSRADQRRHSCPTRNSPAPESRLPHASETSACRLCLRCPLFPILLAVSFTSLKASHLCWLRGNRMSPPAGQPSAISAPLAETRESQSKPSMLVVGQVRQAIIVWDLRCDERCSSQTVGTYYGTNGNNIGLHLYFRPVFADLSQHSRHGRRTWAVSRVLRARANTQRRTG